MQAYSERSGALTRILPKRIVQIASVALFLASGGVVLLITVESVLMRFILDESSYVNGQNIGVDGGLSASHPVMPGKVA